MKRLCKKEILFVCCGILLLILSQTISFNAFSTSSPVSQTSSNPIPSLIVLDESIKINASDNAINWAWAASQSWCSGSGTHEDPYLIENVRFTFELRIYNSNDVFFIIQNCDFINASSATIQSGLYLNNCSKGIVQNSYFNGNYYGITILWYSHDLVIYNNQILNDLQDTDEGVGIYCYYYCNNISLYQNDISLKKYGIYLYFHVQNSTIAHNFIEYNYEEGIHASITSNFNVFYGNLVHDNGDYGFNFQANAENLIYKNNVFNQLSNAYMIGSDSWNNSQYGNYWGDYMGIDDNLDGLGDTPYSFFGGNDFMPLVNYKPVILCSPKNNLISNIECDGSSLISWNVIDDSIVDPTYDIYFNEQKIVSDQIWYSEIPIVLNLSEFCAYFQESGSVVIRIEISDGNSASVEDSFIFSIDSNVDTIESGDDSLLDRFIGGDLTIISGSLIIGLSIMLARLLSRKSKTDKAEKKKNNSENKK